MTPKQMYSELAKIIGKRCATGEKFGETASLTEIELAALQASLKAILDKLNYRRFYSDFGYSPSYERRMRELEQREVAASTGRRRRAAAVRLNEDGSFMTAAGPPDYTRFVHPGTATALNEPEVGMPYGNSIFGVTSEEIRVAQEQLRQQMNSATQAQSIWADYPVPRMIIDADNPDGA